jgi:CheY-like chemotaxis protein
MTGIERRSANQDRRLVLRGGRRTDDRPGRFPLVLVAESYDGARIPCVKYLDRFGFLVEEAADGAEALAKIRLCRPHVVITESELPNASVSRIVEELHALGLLGRVPLLVTTTDPEPFVGHAEGIALVALLSKPFPLSTMLEEIRRLLHLHPPVSPATSADAGSLSAVLPPGTVVDSI